jgi:hypothetical protein
VTTSEHPPVYTHRKPALAETPEQLRARIPGWGADLDPADRPCVPRLQWHEDRTGAHWDLPEQQPELWPRERSMEHERLPPVFGTSCPRKGLSGVLRTYAYARHSEAKAMHWLVLLAADRVDAWESHLRSLATLRPDNPVSETGVRTEVTYSGLRSRLGRGRTDVAHQPLDPLLVAGPWLAGGAVAAAGVRALLRARRRDRG